MQNADALVRLSDEMMGCIAIEPDTIPAASWKTQPLISYDAAPVARHDTP